ncbi:unnamed protein product [Acanthoscelides obtectus]|uniref:Uncharacterized protein n=1 Tax=Acanthoscelides obtectus TaxID=200917 RepID=A0A9P0KP75_ACAOB|nr:unnamed protein product [Acanthoscelides obtectus]CAK1622090.1 hypothetical protein AOBTE_LOCUS1305 [Acanthoscelides obtectus]
MANYHSRTMKIMSFVSTNECHTPSSNENLLVLDIPEVTKNLFDTSEVPTCSVTSDVIYNDPSTNCQHVKSPGQPTGPLEFERELLVCYPVTSNISILEHEFLSETNKIPCENDPNYVPTADSSGADEPIEPARKRRRRHLVNENTWKQNINKSDRERGEQYLGRKKIDGVWKTTPKPKRMMGPRCQCKLSNKKSNSLLECQKLTDDDRKKYSLNFGIR